MSAVVPLAILAALVAYTLWSALIGRFHVTGFGRIERADDPVIFWFAIVAMLSVTTFMITLIYRSGL